MMSRFVRILILFAGASSLRAAETVEFAHKPGAVEITVGGKQLATYTFDDKEVPRPFFANIYLPGGPKLTRNHPPIPGKDDLDHGVAGSYFHPGMWLAFADLNGNDYWRLKAQVRHEEFVEQPTGGAGQGSFVVRNSYRAAENSEQIVCNELCRYTILVRPKGCLIVCDAALRSDTEPLVFGDQEEMGFGVRVAKPLAVKNGGRMIDSFGRVNQREIWSHEAAWCDYSGSIDGRSVGLMLAPDPANRFPSRFHARDYGFFAANPFGGQVFGEKQPRKTVIARGEALRLRFGVLLHADTDEGKTDRQALYEDAIRSMAATQRPTF
jgi:hypothetical protein